MIILFPNVPPFEFKKTVFYLLLFSLNRKFSFAEFTIARKNSNKFAFSEFSHDSVKIQQANLCIRCSKIWFFARLIVNLQKEIYDNGKNVQYSRTSDSGG